MLEKDKIIIKKLIKYCNNISEILSTINNEKEKYLYNNIFQLSTDMCIFQIGELSSHMSEDFKLKHLDIPWAEMKGMRNIHAHEYDNVNREQMWITLTEDIPTLKCKLLKLDIL